MQFALLIYESPEAFAARNNGDDDPYLGAWRAYYQSIVAAGVYLGGDALDLPNAGSTVRVKDKKRWVQDGPYADTREQLAGFLTLEAPSLQAALQWAERCPAAALGAVEVRALAVERKQRITG